MQPYKTRNVLRLLTALPVGGHGLVMIQLNGTLKMLNVDVKPIAVRVLKVIHLVCHGGMIALPS